MPKVKAERTIEIEVGSYELSELMMKWIQENTIGKSESHFDYFIKDNKMYEGENNKYVWDEAKFITDDERIITMFKAGNYLREM